MGIPFTKDVLVRMKHRRPWPSLIPRRYCSVRLLLSTDASRAARNNQTRPHHRCCRRTGCPVPDASPPGEPGSSRRGAVCAGQFIPRMATARKRAADNQANECWARIKRALHSSLFGWGADANAAPGCMAGSAAARHASCACLARRLRRAAKGLSSAPFPKNRHFALLFGTR